MTDLPERVTDLAVLRAEAEQQLAALDLLLREVVRLQATAAKHVVGGGCVLGNPRALRHHRVEALKLQATGVAGLHRGQGRYAMLTRRRAEVALALREIEQHQAQAAGDAP